MGMPRDMAQRTTLARNDNENRQRRVAAARRAIYENNYAVNSKAVNEMLQEDSLVPTTVCIVSDSVQDYSSQVAYVSRTHFPVNCLDLGFVCSLCSLWT